MEKLSLEKFQDVKLDSKQLSFVLAGTCTGGGSGWYKRGKVTVVYEYGCDDRDSSGQLIYYNWEENWYA